ncbi:MAG: membrane dipeptidase, partial [Clostridia bacterium]|nr:membrane dipeptidase [Clostridia bacterium]
AGAGCHAKGGLTAFGRALVGEMARLRFIIDVSHLSDQGFDDVAACTDVPFIASHSNARAVCGSARNLTDAQFCEIVRRGGLAGLNFYPEFINSRKKTVYEDILYHVEHFLELGGEDALAIGADFDGAVVPTGAAAAGYRALPYNLHGIEDMETVYNFLLGYYPEPVVDKIFFANACRFFKRYLTE